MKIDLKKFGIEFTIKAKDSPFLGMRTAMMSLRYGIPKLFPSASSALKFAKTFNLKDPKVIPKKTAYLHMLRTVEFYSGRLTIKNKKWYKSNDFDSRLSYKNIMKSIKGMPK